MKTIQRIYIYLVAFVSAEVVTWALVELIRSAVQPSIGSNAEALAGALAAIIVGGVMFGLHWMWAQRDAAKSPEERFSGPRAIFLNVAVAALFIPVVQNVLALAYRGLAQVLNYEISSWSFAGNQTFSDNLIAIVGNALVGWYFISVLRDDWKAQPRGEAYPLARRIARYAWMLYGLGIAIPGMYQLIIFLFSLRDAVGGGATQALAQGISFTLVGAPLWAYLWGMAQGAIDQPGERTAWPRLVSLYGLVLIAAVAALAGAGSLIYELLRLIFGATDRFADLLNGIEEPLAAGIPAAVVWAYFSDVMGKDRAADPDAPRRDGMRRVYHYVLAFIGLTVTFFGLEALLVFIVDLLFGGGSLGGGWQRDLANVLAMLIVGLPLWLRIWLPLNAEAAQDGEGSDHARRSLNRRGYLYLTMFFTVIGIMFAAGLFLFYLIQLALGDKPSDFGEVVVQALGSVGLMATILVYHLQALRKDNKLSASALGARHADFSVAVFDPGSGNFASKVAEALQDELPQMPVAVHPIGEAFDDSLQHAGAAVLPADVATNPPEAVRLWLEQFGGTRVIVPAAADGWVWVGLDEAAPEKFAKEAAQVVRQLAEGETVRRGARTWWYVVGGIFVFPFLCFLISVIGELFF